MADIPNDLELNQEDFSDVLPRLPDDLQDFDLFEGLLDSFFLNPAPQYVIYVQQQSMKRVILTVARVYE